MKTRFFVFILMGVLVTAVVSIAFAASDKANDKAKEKAPKLEKIEFIHWKKGFAKPPCNNDGVCDPDEKPSCSDCKSNGGGEDPPTTESSCYAFMGQYGKKLLEWRTLPVQYVINPQNPYGHSADFITTEITAAVDEWDYYAIPDLISDSYEVNSEVEYGVADGKNAIVFGDYPTAGVIAVTLVWYNPATKAIVEFDIKFDTDWNWGDASDPDTPNVMDLQNIAVHELGHAVGLADVYDDVECSEVSMYGYSDNGETSKRSLEEPDIIGLTMLYE